MQLVEKIPRIQLESPQMSSLSPCDEGHCCFCTLSARKRAWHAGADCGGCVRRPSALGLPLFSAFWMGGPISADAPGLDLVFLQWSVPVKS